MFQEGSPAASEPLRALVALSQLPREDRGAGRSLLVIKETLILDIFTSSVVPFREPYR